MAEVARTFPSEIKDRPFDLWRYQELLPIHNPNPTLRLGEGGTPLIQAANLGMMLGVPNLFIKDERQGPTSSFKDRQAAVTIAALKEGGVTEMVAASTGNVAISLSAYAARAGIKLWAFVTSLVPGVKIAEARRCAITARSGLCSRTIVFIATVRTKTTARPGCGWISATRH
jgi:threonine synthase